MVDLVTLVVYIFLDVLDTLVATLLYGGILIIYNSVTVVTPSISPPISVAGVTLEALGIPWTFFSLFLFRSDLYKSDIMVTIEWWLNKLMYFHHSFLYQQTCFCMNISELFCNKACPGTYESAWFSDSFGQNLWQMMFQWVSEQT